MTDGLQFDVDDRWTDPGENRLRRARFRAGWKKAVAGGKYSPKVLEKLTWQNLGYRLGKLFKETSADHIDAMYEWCVRQQPKKK